MKCSCGGLLKNHSIKCSDQDVRNLRCENGSTSMGGQVIVQCMTEDCLKKYTGNELAALAVDEMLNYKESIEDGDEFLFDVDGFWFQNSINSKRQVMMELETMREFVRQKNNTTATNQRKFSAENLTDQKTSCF